MEAGTQTELSAAPTDQHAADVIAGQIAAGPACQKDTCCKPGTPGQRPQTAARPATSRSRVATPAPAVCLRPQSALVQAAQLRPATAAGAVAAPATGTDRMLPCRPKTAAAAAASTGAKLTDKTPMVLSFNPDPRLRSWQRLEHQRLHKLGLSSKLSRRYNVTRTLDFQPVGQRLPEAPRQGTWLPSLAQSQQLGFYAEMTRTKNEVAPFRTFQKPICGAFFSRDTDNKKIKHDLQPTDLIKWRYYL